MSLLKYNKIKIVWDKINLLIVNFNFHRTFKYTNSQQTLKNENLK